MPVGGLERKDTQGKEGLGGKLQATRLGRAVGRKERELWNCCPNEESISPHSPECTWINTPAALGGYKHTHVKSPPRAGTCNGAVDKHLFSKGSWLNYVSRELYFLVSSILDFWTGKMLAHRGSSSQGILGSAPAATKLTSNARMTREPADRKSSGNVAAPPCIRPHSRCVPDFRDNLGSRGEAGSSGTVGVTSGGCFKCEVSSSG